MMQDKNGKPISYSAYNPNTGNNILMKLEELSIFKASVENNLGYNIEKQQSDTFVCGIFQNSSSDFHTQAQIFDGRCTWPFL
jgi:hypothetical protein